jgi:hypothetical protein
MKLTENEIEDIRRKLAIPLSNKEFIEEITDHFVLDIEHQMQNEATSFEKAFTITKNNFGGVDGLVKMQNHYLKRYKKMIIKDLSWMSFKSLFTSPIGVFWTFLIGLGCCFYEEIITWKYTPVSLLLPIVTLLIIYIFQLYQNNVFKYSNEKVGTKVGLIVFSHLIAFQVFNIYFSLFHNILKITPIKLDFAVYGIAVWVFYVSIQQLKNEQKKYLKKV